MQKSRRGLRYDVRVPVSGFGGGGDVAWKDSEAAHTAEPKRGCALVSMIFSRTHSLPAFLGPRGAKRKIVYLLQLLGWSR